MYDETLSPAPVPAGFFGRCWALILAVALLLSLGTLTGLRWLGGSEGLRGQETAVQIPVATGDLVAPAKDLTAPDPDAPSP